MGKHIRNNIIYGGTVNNASQIILSGGGNLQNKLNNIDTSISNINSNISKCLSQKSVIMNGDLNDYRDIGLYFVNNSASTVANAPSNGAFNLINLKPLSDNTYVSQIAINYSNGIEYIRTYNPNASTWTSWENHTNKLQGSYSSPKASNGKLLTVSKTLEAGAHVICVSYNGDDYSELPAIANKEYGYALVIVRTKGDMISIFYFNGIAKNDIWYNSSNNGVFNGWTKIL